MLSVIKQMPVVSRQLIVNVDMTPTRINHSTHQPCAHMRRQFTMNWPQRWSVT